MRRRYRRTGPTTVRTQPHAPLFLIDAPFWNTGQSSSNPLGRHSQNRRLYMPGQTGIDVATRAPARRWAALGEAVCGDHSIPEPNHDLRFAS